MVITIISLVTCNNSHGLWFGLPVPAHLFPRQDTCPPLGPCGASQVGVVVVNGRSSWAQGRAHRGGLVSGGDFHRKVWEDSVRVLRVERQRGSEGAAGVPESSVLGSPHGRALKSFST